MRGEGPKRLRPEWLSKEPPAPKVFDADGVEIHKGDTVWSLGGGGPYTVAGFDGGTPYVLCDNGKGAVPALEPGALTHRSPVLAADGKPIREGETVYVNVDHPCFADILIGDAVTVVNLSGKSSVTVRDGKGCGWFVDADQLTHEQLDNWERLWMDMHPSDETECVGLGRDEFVRRAKALAERGQ